MRTFAVAALAACSFARSAEAVTVFTERSAWEAALTNPSLITLDTFSTDFDNSARRTFDSGVRARIGPGGVVIQGNEHRIDNGQYRIRFVRNGAQQTQINFVTWTFPEEIFAFGMDIFNATTSSSGLRIDGDYDGAGVQQISVSDLLPQPGTGFFGVVREASFDEIILRRAGGVANRMQFDNLAFASPAEVPLPATLPMMGAIVLALSLLLRRARRA